MIINLGSEFGSYLESSDDAIELIDILNKIPDDYSSIYFKEVIFVTMNFAQAYYSSKYKSSKKISEINLSDEVSVVMGAADEACNP